MLRLEGVAKSYGRSRVLDGVDVTFPRNTVNFLMGPNGAGKTTLIRSVLGLHRYQGIITWDGRPVDTGERRIFPVFEDAAFHPRLTGQQNLRVLAPESLGGPYTYLPDDVLRRKVKGYSHGERTRLALSACLNSGAELMLLDEPTNGLDRDTMTRLKRDLRSLTPTTTFLVTGHNLEFYDDLVDTLFILVEGQVRAVGEEFRTSEGRFDLARVYYESYPAGAS